MYIDEARKIALDIVTELEYTLYKVPKWSYIRKFVNKDYVSYLHFMHEIDQLMSDRDNDWEG